MLKEVKESKWKLLSVGESVYHKQGGGDNMYNLKFVSVDYDKKGNELSYGYFEAVYSLENPDDEYSKDNPPIGKLLERDTDFVNMGTYNYGGNAISHIGNDVIPYNIVFGKGNVGEDAGFIIPKDYKIFKDNALSNEHVTYINNFMDLYNIFNVDKETIEKINLSQENIMEFIRGLK